MPTGYTSKLYDKEQSFAEFVWTCARAFGALINMRDEALDAPLQLEEEQPKESYSAKALAEEQAELERLRHLSRADCDREAAAEYAKAVDLREKMIEEAMVIRKRYLAMAKEVEAWTPPTQEHAGLKKFMLEQIQESLRYDCLTQEPPQKLDGYTWVQQKLAVQVRSITHSAESAGKTESARRSRRQWIDDLLRSVPLPKSRRP